MIIDVDIIVSIGVVSGCMMLDGLCLSVNSR